MKKGNIILENNLLVAVEMSTSLITKFIKNGNEIDYCPKQIYETYMTGNYLFESSIPMRHGIYFETMLLGANVSGTEVEPLLTKKTKKPTAEQARIDIQIELAKQVFKERKIVVRKDNVQVKGSRHLIMPSLDFNVHLTQVADLISPIEYRGEFYENACIDVKLTGSLSNTFGDFAWGNFKYMDKIQAYIASYVHDLPFFYIVFDYPATNMGYRIFKVNTIQGNKSLPHDSPFYNELNMRYSEMKETARKVAIYIDYHFNTQWEARPETSLCTTCPLNTQCEDSYKFETEY